jgi:hypothetical protein
MAKLMRELSGRAQLAASGARKAEADLRRLQGSVMPLAICAAQHATLSKCLNAYINTMQTALLDVTATHEGTAVVELRKVIDDTIEQMCTDVQRVVQSGEQHGDAAKG